MSRWILGAAVTALVAALGVETLLWLDANQLPDGYQNEYLHVGNAMDLWGAVVDRAMKKLEPVILEHEEEKKKKEKEEARAQAINEAATQTPTLSVTPDH